MTVLQDAMYLTHVLSNEKIQVEAYLVEHPGRPLFSY